MTFLSGLTLILFLILSKMNTCLSLKCIECYGLAECAAIFLPVKLCPTPGSPFTIQPVEIMGNSSGSTITTSRSTATSAITTTTTDVAIYNDAEGIDQHPPHPMRAACTLILHGNNVTERRCSQWDGHEGCRLFRNKVTGNTIVCHCLTDFCNMNFLKIVSKCKIDLAQGVLIGMIMGFVLGIVPVICVLMKRTRL